MRARFVLLSAAGCLWCLNRHSGEWLYELTDRKRGIEFIAFVATFLSATPSARSM